MEKTSGKKVRPESLLLLIYIYIFSRLKTESIKIEKHRESIPGGTKIQTHPQNTPGKDN